MSDLEQRAMAIADSTPIGEYLWLTEPVRQLIHQLVVDVCVKKAREQARIDSEIAETSFSHDRWPEAARNAGIGIAKAILASVGEGGGR